MSETNQPRFKLGRKGSVIFTLVMIAILLFVLFGGKGTSTLGMIGYATMYDANNPGSVKLFDIGARSKVAIIRHEDGSLSGLSFRKIPLLDRWKVTKETVPLDVSDEMKLWMSVDDGFSKYIVISDGETLTEVENNGWHGIYARLLYNAAFVLTLSLLFALGKRLWKRRQVNKNPGVLPE